MKLKITQSRTRPTQRHFLLLLLPAIKVSLPSQTSRHAVRLNHLGLAEGVVLVDGERSRDEAPGPGLDGLVFLAEYSAEGRLQTFLLGRGCRESRSLLRHQLGGVKRVLRETFQHSERLRLRVT